MSHYAMRKLLNHRRPGLTLLMVIVFLGVVLTFATIIYERSHSYSLVTSRRISESAAIAIAEGGIEKAVWCLNNPSIIDARCPGNPGDYVGETDVALGTGRFTTTITTPNIDSRLIDSYGTINGALSAVTKHLQIKLITTNTSVSFNFGLQAGVGGVVMEQNNTIIGNVYSNGSVLGGGNTRITGDAILATSSPAQGPISDPAVSPLLTKNIGDSSSTLFLAQKFRSLTNDAVYSVDLKIAKHNNPTSTLTAYIYSDNAGTPGVDISSGGQLFPAGGVVVLNDSPSGWENGWTSQPYTPRVVLVPDTDYWLVLQVSGSNSSKYWTVVHDADDTAYADGTAKIGSLLGSLTALNYDLAFRIMIGGTNPTLKLSSGVGGKALAYNIDNTIVSQHACYQVLTSSVTAHGETCSQTNPPSAGAVPCDAGNTQSNTPSNGKYCHANSPNQTPAPFPLSSAQIAQMEALAANGGTIDCSAGCTVSSGTIGPKVYGGDLTIGGPVTLLGTVWVKGNLYLNDNITLSAAYGPSNGLIIADDTDDPNDLGNSRVDVGGGDLLGYTYHLGLPDEKKTFIMVIAMGKSVATTEDTAAFSVKNNLTAAIVYAANGSVYLKNNASLNEITGQLIYMKNNADITYQSGMASSLFSAGPGGSWVYQHGTYQVIK